MRETAVEKLLVTRPALKTPTPTSHCPGCHYGIILRLACEVIEEMGLEDRAACIAGVGCSSSWAQHINADGAMTPHGRALPAAAALKRLRPNLVVFTVQGDGDLLAIGSGHFLNTMARGERLTTIFLNNAGFGTTGGQMAPTTPMGMLTTTTGEGRDPETTGFPIHAAELAATMRGVAYSARVTVHTPANRQRAKRALLMAFQKQVEGIGFSIVEFISACPPNWHLSPRASLKFIDDVMLAEFPLGEFKNVDSIDRSPLAAAVRGEV